MDAVFVAANAGEYEAGDYPKIRYTSDGKGGVTFAYQTNGPCREWGGIDFHMRPVPTRFLPLPPKDNKCESSSGCGAESLTPSQPSRRRRCE